MVIDLEQKRAEREALFARLARSGRRREWLMRFGGHVLGVVCAVLVLLCATVPEDRVAVLRATAVRVAFPGFRLIPVRASAE